MSPLIAAVEAGGTKMIAALASGPDDIRARISIPTTTPQETIPALCDFFIKESKQHGSPAALVVGTFGPAEINPHSDNYGTITNTPKPFWKNTPLLKPLQEALNVPALLETDVNAALVGEAQYGAARGLDHAAYLTIGTGIGGALLMNKQFHHGHSHPEMGHFRPPRHPKDDFPGICRFHQDCLEGLASGKALQERTGIPAEQLPDDHPIWELIAHYLAHACLNLITITSPERIILGGGVMARSHLFPQIRATLQDLLGGYLTLPPLETFIVPPHLGKNSALLGCVSLGKTIIPQ